MKTRNLKIALVIIGLFFLLNVSIAVAGDTIKIGIISAFKTPPGESLLNAAKMASEDINAQGGIWGKKIDLVLANDEYKPEKGSMAYKKLVLEDQCDVIVGTCSSGVAKAIMDQMARYKKLFLSSGAAAEGLSDLFKSDRAKYKYWFRVCHRSVEQSQAILDFIYDLPIKKMGGKRVAILAENALWTRSMVDDALKFFKERGIEVVYSELVDTETKDFTTILSKIINLKADFIYEISAHIDGAIYIKQWYDLKGPMIGGPTASGLSDRYWKDCGGKAVSESVTSFPGSFPVALTPKTIPFYNRYVDKFKEFPNYTAGYTYDALYIYKAAVEKGKTTNSETLVPIIEKGDYVGAGGRWVFEDDHNARYGEGYRQFTFLQWREDGSRAVVWPRNVATGEFLPPPWKKK